MKAKASSKPLLLTPSERNDLLIACVIVIAWGQPDSAVPNERAMTAVALLESFAEDLLPLLPSADEPTP